MIFLANAMACTFAAFFWNRSSPPNLAVGIFFAMMAVVNAALAYPFISRFIGP